MDDDKAAKYFGYLIAFLVPGLLGVWALSFYAPPLRSWLGTAEKAETSVGAFLFVALMSLALGVFIGGVRCFVFEHAIFKVWPLKVDDRVDDESERMRREKDTLVAYQDLREQFLRFYQCYGGTAIGLAMLFAAWWPKGWLGETPKSAAAIAFALAELVLVISARDSLQKFRKKKAALFATVAPATDQPKTEGSLDDKRRRDPQGSSEGGTTPPTTATTPTAPTTSASTAPATPTPAPEAVGSPKAPR